MNDNTYPHFSIATGDGKCSLELLPQHGGLFNKLVLTFPDGTRQNVIAGLNSLASIENNNYYRGVPLYPFVNRLRDGQYEHGGQTYQFDVNEADRNTALHGFLFDINPEVTVVEQGNTSATVRLDYHYSGDRPAYPFCADIWMVYTLKSPGELSLEMGVTNHHSTTVPVGLGWHPYFQLGETVDNLLLQLPDSKRVEVDAERLLPTGSEEDYQTFSQLRPIGQTGFDTCFHLTQGSTTKPVSKVIICSQSSHIGLEIWQQAGEGKLDYLQVCIPPDRQSIAVEPVSCNIDAFNTKQGLTMLEANETWRTLCGVRAILQKQ